MKVLFLENVKGMGKMDEIKEVADGFARNFLFPKNLAVPANKQSIQQKQEHDNKKAKDEIKDLQKQQALAEKIEMNSLDVKAKVNENGILYSAVNAQIIAQELKKKNIQIDKSQIFLEPIKEPGEFTAKIKLRHGIEAELDIIVSG